MWVHTATNPDPIVPSIYSIRPQEAWLLLEWVVRVRSCDDFSHQPKIVGFLHWTEFMGGTGIFYSFTRL
jgi:hypothetical protein